MATSNSDADPGVLQLTFFVLGSNGTRANIEMRPTVPADIRGDTTKVAAWSSRFAISSASDVKHTAAWDCAFCGQPSREIMYSLGAWTHLTPPKVVVWTHHLCSTRPGPCKTAFDEVNAEMAKASGIPGPPHVPRRTTPANAIVDEKPLARTCGKCHSKDEGLSRCSGCKLITYCSKSCQGQDWSRHKPICKTVKSVDWEWD